MAKIAVVRIRGIRKIDPDIKFTLGLLRLHSPNHCVLVNNTPAMVGMLKIVKDYVTYGPINEKTASTLLLKRGKSAGNALKETKKKEELEQLAKKMFSEPKTEGVDPVFRLRPPRKGHRDVKLQYPKGSLGKRPELDTLLARMI